MATTVASDVSLDLQVLTETVQGVFAQKTAFMGSLLVSSGVVTVDGTLPGQGPQVIGTEVTVPYFGTLGSFVDNADGSSVTASKLASTSEKATVKRQSLAFEASRWAQNKIVGIDPYEESARQIMTAAERAMDQQIIDAFTASGALSYSLYSATSPRILQQQDVAMGRAIKWGDESDGVVAMIVHSLTAADFATQTDTLGRPLLAAEANGTVRVMGVPCIVSDRIPLTGSTMGTVTSTGTSAPVATITGTPTGPWDLVIDCVVGGAHQTATIRFSTDGGATWSATLTTAGVGAALALTDTATDSIVGNNGATGLSVAFASGTFNADNLWTSKANVKARSILCRRGAGAFWYNRSALQLQKYHNIYNDVDAAAMHLYGAAHRYRRVRGGTKPGVLVIDHNVSAFTG